MHDVVRASNSPGPSLERRDVEVALRLFSEDGSGIVRKVGDSAGGLFVVGTFVFDWQESSSDYFLYLFLVE